MQIKFSQQIPGSIFKANILFLRIKQQRTCIVQAQQLAKTKLKNRLNSETFIARLLKITFTISLCTTIAPIFYCIKLNTSKLFYNQASGYSGNAGDSLSQLIGNAWSSQVKDTFSPERDCDVADHFTGGQTTLISSLLIQRQIVFVRMHKINILIFINLFKKFQL